MNCLKNIPELASSNLESLISVREGQIVSMALSKLDHTQLVLFAAAAGETISDEAYPGDTLYCVLSGCVKVQVGDRRQSMAAGDALAVPAGTVHALAFFEGTKFLQITLNA